MYAVRDASNGEDFSHAESKSGQLTQGEYSVLLPDGRRQVRDIQMIKLILGIGFSVSVIECYTFDCNSSNYTLIITRTLSGIYMPKSYNTLW